MRTSTSDGAAATRVRLLREAIVVDLRDGRSVTVPLSWYPRLQHATARERRNWRLVGRGAGIHWPDLDEDVSVAGILAGRPSGESRASLARWLAGRPVRRATSRGPAGRRATTAAR